MKRSVEITSKIMASIKSKDTKPELLLGRSMWQEGLRYRKHYKVSGKPDFVFVKKKIAIFCDGDFWHGNNWKIRKLKSLEDELDSYSDFWKAKIIKNIQRDKEVTRLLLKDGWIVIRFWSSDIIKDVKRCTNQVIKVIKE
jgi:DNA mismatch endonuclease (patch repair protein)